MKRLFIALFFAICAVSHSNAHAAMRSGARRLWSSMPGTARQVSTLGSAPIKKFRVGYPYIPKGSTQAQQAAALRTAAGRTGFATAAESTAEAAAESAAQPGFFTRMSPYFTKLSQIPTTVKMAGAGAVGYGYAQREELAKKAKEFMGMQQNNIEDTIGGVYPGSVSVDQGQMVPADGAVQVDTALEEPQMYEQQPGAIQQEQAAATGQALSPEQQRQQQMEILKLKAFLEVRPPSELAAFLATLTPEKQRAWLELLSPKKAEFMARLLQSLEDDPISLEKPLIHSADSEIRRQADLAAQRGLVKKGLGWMHRWITEPVTGYRLPWVSPLQPQDLSIERKSKDLSAEAATLALTDKADQLRRFAESRYVKDLLEDGTSPLSTKAANLQKAARNYDNAIDKLAPQVLGGYIGKDIEEVRKAEQQFKQQLTSAHPLSLYSLASLRSDFTSKNIEKIGEAQKKIEAPLKLQIDYVEEELARLREHHNRLESHIHHAAARKLDTHTFDPNEQQQQIDVLKNSQDDVRLKQERMKLARAQLKKLEKDVLLKSPAEIKADQEKAGAAKAAAEAQRSKGSSGYFSGLRARGNR